MKETFDQAQLTQILYDISMSIGTSVELPAMLKNSLSTILKKLDCDSGGVYQHMEKRGGSIQFEAAYTIPRRLGKKATYQEALECLPECTTKSDYESFLKTLPIISESQEGHFFHILELPNFGLLILIKNQEVLEMPIIKSLKPLLNKFAAAALACVSEAKLRHSEERHRKFTEATFDGIMVHDGPIVTEINPALAAAISYTPEELIGKNIFDFLDPSCHDLARDNALTLTEAPYELIALSKDGKRVPVEVTDREFTEDERTYRVTAVRNLSRQKQLESQETLHDVSLELSSIQDLDELYKQVIIQAREKLGFDRVGLYLIDPEKQLLRGAYGISTKGKLESIENDVFNFSEGDWVKDLIYNQERVLVKEDSELMDGQEIVGHGWNIIAALWIRETPIGVLFADNLISQDPFQPHLPALLSAYSTDVANLINRLRAEEALQKSQSALNETLERQQALHEVTLELSSIQDLDELYQQLILKARERLGFDRIGLFLVDMDAEELMGTYGINPQGELISIKHDIFNFSDGDWVKRIVKSEERVFVREDTDLLEGQEVIGRGWHLTATMKIRGRLIGVMFADNMVSRQPYQPHLPELISAYSTDAANLIERLHSEQDLRESEQTMQEFLEKQQELHEIGIKLSSVTNLETLFKEAIQLAQSKLGFSRIGMYLYDPDREIVHGTYGINVDGTLRSEYHLEHVLDEEPWIQRFLYDHQRLTVSEDGPLHEDNEVVGQGWNITAAMWNRGRPIGLLFADNLLDQEPLKPYQPELLTAFGSTVANLIDRLSSDEEREYLLQNTEKQAESFALLNEMGTALNQAESIDDVYKIAGDYTLTITQDKRASLALLTPDKQSVELFGLSGIKGAVPLGTKLPVEGTGIGTAIQENRQLSFLEEAEMDSFIDTKKMASEGLQSAVVTPLMVEGQVIGSLNVADQSAIENAAQKRTLMQQVAGLVASAIQIRRAQERTDTILQSITAPMLISRVTDGMIFYTNELLAEMVKVPLNDLVGNQTPNFYVRGEDRKAVIEKIRSEGSIQNYELELQRSDGDPFWGLLTAKLIQFEGEPAIITTLIDISERKEAQAAIEQQAVELRTVAELSTQITSIQNPQELMETIVQETQRRFDLYHCHIFLVDESGKNLRIQACGWHPDAKEYGNHGDSVIAINAKKSLVAQAARNKQAVVINDVVNDPNWLPNELLPDTRSELAVPIIVGDTVLGVLDVQSTQVDRFDSEDVQIQLTLAAQTAVALENARSLARSQQAIAEMDALTRRLTRESWEGYLSELEEKETSFIYDFGELKMGEDDETSEPGAETAVSTNGHLSQSLMVHGESIGHLTIFNDEEAEGIDADTALIIAAVAEQLSARVENIRLTDQTQQALAQTQDQAQRLGMLNEISAEMSNTDTLNQVFNVIFARIPELLNVDRVSLAMLRPDKETLEVIGFEGERMDAPAGTVVPLAGTVMEKAIAENRVLGSEVTSSDSTIKSSMVAPLTSAGRTIGTLNIGSKTAHALTDRDRTLMQQLATMLSSVIENKQLLAAAQARAERERQVRTITDKIRRGVDREAILNIAQQEISKLIGAKQSAAQLGTKTQLLERIQYSIEKTQNESD